LDRDAVIPTQNYLLKLTDYTEELGHPQRLIFNLVPAAMRQRQTEAATESRALKMKFYCGLELLPNFNKMINEILVMKHMKRRMLIHV
jgi:hypothetical protein